MSFSIEYNRKLYKHPAFSAGDGDIYYILLVKRGDSNVYTTERRRVREWYLAFYGDESQFWQYVGETGGYCEGGELQRVIGWSGSRWCHIEEYIELYRKVFRHAKPLESILDDFNIFLNIELTGNEMIPMLISDIRNSAK